LLGRPQNRQKAIICQNIVTHINHTELDIHLLSIPTIKRFACNRALALENFSGTSVLGVWKI